MREGVTYKPFDDCFDKIKTPKGVPSKDYLESGTYPVISQEEEFISGYNNDDSKLLHIPRPVVIFGDHSRVIKYVDFDFVLGADGVKVLLPKVECDAKYIYYFLKHFNVPSLGYSRHFKLLREAQIPVPSLSDQELIVRELASISSVISAKKQQVLELDNLAQAIFLDTFGDPITNPKGWEVKKLGEVSELLNGRAYSKEELLDKGKYRVLRVGNFFTNDSWYYSNLELPDNKYCDKGDLLFAWSASFGARIWDGEKVIYHYHIWKVMYDEAYLNKIFYCHLLNHMMDLLKNDTHGIGMVHLTKVGMEQYGIPLPPLSLQQAFAEKVQAIEEQKRLINQSIAEFESLLAQRMEFHFA